MYLAWLVLQIQEAKNKIMLSPERALIAIPITNIYYNFTKPMHPQYLSNLSKMFPTYHV